MGEASYEVRKRPLESDLPEQIEVRVRRERRRRWTAADKLRIVEEAFAPGAVAKRVAERHEISTGLLCPVRHHRAMPWQDAPAFIAELAKQRGTAAEALLFLAYTETRSGEVRGATWREIEGDVWVIPAHRTKTGVQHRVPLTPAAASVLATLTRRGDDALIFPGAERDKPISDMSMTMLMRRMGCDAVPHGWRSCFRDWAGDQGWPRDLAEAALAHTLGKVEGAYARSDLVKRRRPMMEAWSAYITSQPVQVVPIRLRGTAGLSGSAVTESG